ncbi:MAG: methionyl-tRNA formyltransferase [Firmicutes bacterium]|nr:methionyl-tRNA formyltransferase [Bacillota bacterium]
MKVVFMGTPDFAVPTLEALIDKHEVTAVISQPDKPKGRGKKLQPTPVKEAAEAHNIPVYQPEKIRDEAFVKTLAGIEADVFVVVAYGQILPQSILDMPKYGCINVHGSLLPKYRGAAPIQWSIINGETMTGVTIMYMEKGLDTGAMILKREIPIEPTDTYGTLHDKMAPVGAAALLEALEMLENGSASPEKQDDALSSYVSVIDKSLGNIDWTKDAKSITDLVRGLDPIPGAYSYLNGEQIKIWAAEASDHTGTAGEVVFTDKKKGFAVAAGSGAVFVKQMQAKGGKRMSAADYMRGHEIKIGDRFIKE